MNTHSAQTLSPTRKTEKQFREELESLSKEGGKLNEKRIRIQAEIDRARKEKEDLEASLTAEFGTCDLKELSLILAAREQANESALASYRDGIRRLGEEIEAVTAKISEAK